jgi:hypothetical protein
MLLIASPAATGRLTVSAALILKKKIKKNKFPNNAHHLFSQVFGN